MSDIKTFATVQTLPTPRLTLRDWRDSDLPAFAVLGADPEVMRYFPALLSEAESDDFAAQIRARLQQYGWGFWALELRETREVIGMAGLNIPRVPLPFMPCVEIGWRLARPYWGQGLAYEAAAAALAFGFDELQLDEIVAFTALGNLRSQALMQRLQMRKDDAAEFDHPVLPVGHALRRHCLYRIARGI
ncbi:GNAT family N-acetyltransferase [Chitinibacter bivalviorum]|uniref:GNAT family N-acetyltransferase n=1 Tax=Chitinibacter bivalviorum TaxID=2739434 RepID=A0A7H9BDV5_9NEIS|nr:GNAT family N-acetyltransferase [Chitinibacter bivalviorum]QLG86799.1 GNAT family N-acetyltransferase [Chitinibacter bivalviorum]